MALSPENNKKFDLIFLDPPYKEISIYKEILSFLHTSNMLNDDFIIVCELDSKHNLENIEYFEETKNKKYGNSRIILFEPLED